MPGESNATTAAHPSSAAPPHRLSAGQAQAAATPWTARNMSAN
ncbi:hypothetical protein ACQPYH_13090 [Kribbella sp. CA-245084]